MSAARMLCQRTVMRRHGSATTRCFDRVSAALMHFCSSDAEPVEFPTGGNSHVGCSKFAGDLSKQHLGANPGIHSVAAKVGQSVETSDGFVPLDVKLDLPAEAVQFHNEGGGQSRTRHGRE